MLLIYTHKITPRFSYITKQIFNRILGVEITLATKVEDFIKHTGPKITYTRQPLQNEFFIRSNDLLFEQGINDFDISVEDWKGIPCFFPTGERSNLPFDIFAASFYLISRYEEYLPHLKDMHGRFPPQASFAGKNGFLHLPVIDMWAFKLMEVLKIRFPEIVQKKRSYAFKPIIDVTTSHCYANRGLIRGLAGFLLDLGTFKFKRVGQRILVWLNLRQDPYDNFYPLIELHKKYGLNAMFFFQFASYSTYDKNVSPNNNKFRYLIKSVADYAVVSLAASYSSFRDNKLLLREKRRLSDVINRPVKYSRMRYNRVDIPETYRNLVETEFTDDYTMGYTHAIGFRAGTCTPFYFYDIALETQQPIKIHPFAVHDYALTGLSTQAEIVEKLDPLYATLKSVKGNFTVIFSNELLGGDQKVNWLELYSEVIRRYHV